MTERLTTLAAVKEWLEISNDDSDTQLVRIIEAASQFVLNWLNRQSFQLQTYTQNFRGNGHNHLLLHQWPVVSVTSVGIAGSFISASVPGTAGMPGTGYRVSDPRNSYQSLELFGYGFPRNAPGQVVYSAGFTLTHDFTLPAAVVGKVTLTPTMGGQWSRDRGVVIGGQSLAPTASEDPPSGFYHVDDWGIYTFNGDVAGEVASVSYDYVPIDVSFAVTELIGEWYKRKDRIGVLSKTLGGQETVVFSQRDMGTSIQSSLQPYRNVI